MADEVTSVTGPEDALAWRCRWSRQTLHTVRLEVGSLANVSPLASSATVDDELGESVVSGSRGGESQQRKEALHGDRWVC
jgi:hypothetical protein